MLVFSRSSLKKLLQNEVLHAAAGPFNGSLDVAKMFLIIDAHAINDRSLYADFGVPTYAGYAEQNVVWGAPLFNPLSGFEVIAQPLSFSMTDSLTPTTVYGYGVYVPTDGNRIILLENFDVPRPLVSPDDAVIIIPQLVLSTLGITGAIVLP